MMNRRRRDVVECVSSIIGESKIASAKKFESIIHNVSSKSKGSKDLYSTLAYERIGDLYAITSRREDVNDTSQPKKPNTIKSVATDAVRKRSSFDSCAFDEIRKRRRLENARVINPPKLKKGGMTCTKCGSTNTWFYQMQTRGGDEPMTTFVICAQPKCQKRFVF